MIIGVCGYKRSGKDTVGHYLIQKHGFRRFAFADPIKKMARNLLLDSGASFEDSVYYTDGEGKELPCPYMCGASMRYVFQTLGTEWGREYISKDIWTEITFNAIKNNDGGNSVITDVRLDNEAERVLAEGGYIIRVDRPGCIGGGHVTESGVPDHLVDVFISNDEGVDELYQKVEKALEELK